MSPVFPRGIIPQRAVLMIFIVMCEHRCKVSQCCSHIQFWHDITFLHRFHEPFGHAITLWAAHCCRTQLQIQLPRERHPQLTHRCSNRARRQLLCSFFRRSYLSCNNSRLCSVHRLKSLGAALFAQNTPYATVPVDGHVTGNTICSEFQVNVLECTARPVSRPAFAEFTNKKILKMK